VGGTTGLIQAAIAQVLENTRISQKMVKGAIRMLGYKKGRLFLDQQSKDKFPLLLGQQGKEEELPLQFSRIDESESEEEKSPRKKSKFKFLKRKKKQPLLSDKIDPKAK
jgi:hypothetical protein